MNSSTDQQKPQEVDYRNLERLWGQEANQIPVPVREIIAGVLRKVREDSLRQPLSDSFYSTYPSPPPSSWSDFPLI